MSYRVAGVYHKEVVASTSISSLYEETPVILGKALTGPLTPTEIYSTAGLATVFGPEISSDYGLIGANKVLKSANKIIYCRIAHQGDKAFYSSNAVKVFEAKDGGVALNSTQVDVSVDGTVVEVKLVSTPDTDVVLETIVCSLDPNSDDYVYEAFNNYSQYLDLVATIDTYTFANSETLTITPGTEGAKVAQGSADGLKVSTIYYDEYYNNSVFSISVSATNRISAKLKRGSQIVESIVEGPVDETAEQFVKRFNSNSSVLKITDYSAVKSIAVTLSGGDAGLKTTDDDYIGNSDMGLKTLEDTAGINVGLLLIPGVSSPGVVTYAKSVANNRKDCVYLADPPIGLKAYQMSCWADATGAFAGGSSIDSTYTATFTPWVKDTDSAGVPIFLPPSIFVAAKMAENNQTKNIWDACAGTANGTLDILGLEYNPTYSDRNIFKNCNVNPIIYNSSRGYIIFGNNTGKRTQYPLNPEPSTSLSVRRLVNFIKKTITAMAIDFCFANNDEFTWSEFKLQVDPFLRNIKDNRGLYDYEIVMDETTVTAEKIDALEMPGTIKLKPTRTAEVIDLGFTLYSYGVDFTTSGDNA